MLGGSFVQFGIIHAADEFSVVPDLEDAGVVGVSEDSQFRLEGVG